MKNYQEIDDQSSMIGNIFGLHLKTHGDIPNPDCPFCKGFIIPNIQKSEKGSILESYKFLIIDITENQNVKESKIETA